MYTLLAALLLSIIAVFMAYTLDSRFKKKEGWIALTILVLCLILILIPEVTPRGDAFDHIIHGDILDHMIHEIPFKILFFIGAAALILAWFPRVASRIYGMFENVLNQLNHMVANRVIHLSELSFNRVEEEFDKVNYAIATRALRFSQLVLEFVEFGGIDKFNYIIADGAVSLYRKVRRVQTGMISCNISLAAVALLFILIVLVIVM